MNTIYWMRWRPVEAAVSEQTALKKNVLFEYLLDSLLFFSVFVE